MTLYPNDNYDTFCDVSTADTLLPLYVVDLTSWNALVEATKEIYLRQASLLIQQRITLPDTLEDDLTLATAYLANYSIGKDMINDDDSGNVKRKNVAQTTVETEYFTKGKSSNAFPSLVNQLLSQYGLKSSGTFTMERSI